MVLRAEIRPDKAEAENRGDPTIEGENAIWPDLRRDPKGQGRLS